MPDTAAILHEIHLTADGNVTQEPQENGLSWIHLNRGHPDTEKYLKSSGLEPIALQGLTTEAIRPRFEEVGDNALVVLLGANLNKDATPEDMVSVRIWIEKNRIISAGKRSLQSVEELANNMKSGQGPKTAGNFLSALCHALLEKMDPVLSDLQDQVDQIEEDILDKAGNHLRDEVVQMRRQAIMFRRFLTPQRDVIQTLKSHPAGWMSQQDKRQMKDYHNRIVRYIEDLEALRERGQVVQDEIVNLQTEALNRNLYLISIITVIFMPLTFITGIFGMNVDGLPLTTAGNGFFVVMMAMGILAVIQVILLKCLKWF